MNCPILTPERLEALMQGTLDSATREALREHLREPCEGCLALLGSESGAEAVGALGGSTGRLPELKSQAMFNAAWKRHPANTVVPLRRVVLQVAGALAALVLVGIGLSALFREPARQHGLKGEAWAGSVELSVFAGTSSGAVVPLPAGTPLPDGARALVRYRLEAPGRVWVWAEKGGAREEILSGETMATGEHELTRDGAVLGLDVGGGAVVVAVCSPEAAVPSPEAPGSCSLVRREVQKGHAD